MRRRKLTNTIYHITQFAISFFLIVYYLYLLQIGLQLCRQREQALKIVLLRNYFSHELKMLNVFWGILYTQLLYKVWRIKIALLLRYSIRSALYNDRLFLLRNYFREVQTTVPTWWEEIENWGNEHSSNVAWNVMTIILL